MTGRDLAGSRCRRHSNRDSQDKFRCWATVDVAIVCYHLFATSKLNIDRCGGDNEGDTVQKSAGCKRSPLALLFPRGFTAKELAERCGVTIRTIERT